MRPQGFPRGLRLRKRWEFLRAQQDGVKHHLRHLLVYVVPTPAPRSLATGTTVSRGDGSSATASEPKSKGPRFGVTVTKKLGGSVERNLIKRRLRAAFRVRRAELPVELDLVFIAKRSAATASFAALEQDLDGLVQRLARVRSGGSR